MFRSLAAGLPGYLYHYTPVAVRELVSYNEQVRRRMRPGPLKRGDHDRDFPGDGEGISLFFDPVPFDVVAGHYGRDHAWYLGNQLYENCVAISEIPTTALWSVIETPELTLLADEFWGKIPEDEYWRRERELAQRLHLNGMGGAALQSLAKKYRGSTRAAYQQLIARPDFKDDLEHYYAATVPHVIVRAPTLPVVRAQPVVVGR